jgi:hypothetical protein
MSPDDFMLELYTDYPEAVAGVFRGHFERERSGPLSRDRIADLFTQHFPSLSRQLLDDDWDVMGWIKGQ